MPIYEYQCNACGKVNEVMQKIGAEAPAACDACSSGPLSKILSRSGFILKGSGWYATDFRNGSSSAKTNADTPKEGSTSSASDSGGAGNSDSASGATKTETKAAASGCATGCSHNH